jgi:O-succinylbenzoic acid--CoA ligase
MCKDIIFLPNVSPSTRQKVLNFCKEWKSKSQYITVSTSGSTGKPKLIKLDKNNIKASAKATVDFLNLTPGQSLLLTLSTDYIAGKMMIVRGLEHNLKIIVAPVSSHPLRIDIPYQINFAAFVPMQVKNSLKLDESKRNFTKIEKIIIGGAPVDHYLEKQLQQLPNLNYATFGMTETISHIALKNISQKEPHFTALKHVTFSTDSRSCLIIKAPKISEQPIVTNDIVELLNPNQFVWKGRADFVINSGGIKLHPEQIEQKISPLLKGYRFYVTSEKDELFGEKIILKIETNLKLDIDTLNLHLKKKLHPYELPKSIKLVSNFKDTPTGKIIRE